MTIGVEISTLNLLISCLFFKVTIIQLAVYKLLIRRKLNLLREQKFKEHQASLVIKKFVLGFMHRNEPLTEINRFYLRIKYQRFLIGLAEHLPSNLMKPWPVHYTLITKENLCLEPIFHVIIKFLMQVKKK